MLGNGPEGNNADNVPEYPFEPDGPTEEIERQLDYAVEIPPHDALIINEDTAGAYDSREDVFIVPPLNEMAPEAQEAWLLAAAITTAENGRPEASLDARLAASELLPANDSLFSEIHDEALRLDHRRADRALILAELSRRPYGSAHQAWTTAFSSAIKIGRLPGGHENPHVLELIAEKQTDRLRFADIKWAADNMTEDRWSDPRVTGNAETIPYVQARIYKAVVKQQLAMGETAAAATTFAHMHPGVAPTHRDEAAVYITEAIAKTDVAGGVETATESLAEISQDHMRTWGQLKIGKHDTLYADATQQAIEYKLPQDWPSFTIKQRQAIVRDFVEAGDLHMATAFAGQIADRLSTADERRVQTETVVEVAYAEAETSPYIALRNLRAARDEAFERLTHISSGSAGEAGGTRQITPGQRAAANQIVEYADRFNTLTIHAVAVRAYINPDAAIAGMRGATFIGDQPNIYEGRMRRAVADRLARVGRIEQAAAIASEISDDTDYDSQKSQAFTAIARAVRQQRGLGQ